MRSIFVLLILVMIGLNGKGQSVTALPDSVLSQCCLEVTLLNGNVTTVDWVFIQYITRDGTGTKLFVEYAPNFGGIQWETQIRIQDDFDDVLARSKFIILPFTVGATDYGIHRNWVANIEENTTTGGTWVYGRFGTPTKRKFSAVEDYETMKNRLLACRPRAIVVAENGLYTEGDTVRMGGFLIEPTEIEANTYPFTITDDDTGIRFGLSYTYAPSDTVFYFDRIWAGDLFRQHSWYFGRNKLTHVITNDTSTIQVVTNNRVSPSFNVTTFIGSSTGSSLIVSGNASVFGSSNYIDNIYTNVGTGLNSSSLNLISDSTITGLIMGLFRVPVTGKVFMALKTPRVDDTTAVNGQFLQLKDVISGEVEFATIDLSGYLEIADTAAMLDPYIRTAGWGLVKSAAHTLRVDSTLLATKIFTNRFLLKSDTAAMLAPYVTFGNLSGYPTGSGTTDRSARWSATNTLAAGNFTDNGTKLQALLPFQLQQWTTAGRPTGVTGYEGYNTTGSGKEWYNGTRWAYALESTFARGMAGSIFFADANGQASQDNTNLNWDDTNNRLYVSSLWLNGNGATLIRFTNFSSTELAIGGPTNMVITYYADGGQFAPFYTNQDLGNINKRWRTIYAGNHQAVGGTATLPAYGFQLTGAPAGIGMYFTGTLSNQNLGFSTNSVNRLYITHDGLVGVGTTTPTQNLDVNGDAYIRDSTRLTTTPAHSAITGLLTRDVNGWVGLGTIGTGLSYSGGVLSATATADGNGIYTGSGTLSQHTTRALIPSTGNLFFSQKFNSNADSAYFNIVNYLSGERAVNFGLTDTSSTGYSRGYFESDGAGNMNWTLETNDANGSTTVRALEGVLSLSTTAGNISLSAPVDQEIIATGLVRAKQEAYYEINSTSSPQNLSNTYSDNYINQGGTQATFTLVFPASPEDGQILKITYNNAISSLTLDGNGNTIVGTTVTTAVAGTQRVFKFYAGDSVWIRQN